MKICSRTAVPTSNTVPEEGTRGHMYRTGAWRPLAEEVVAEELKVIQGAIPADLEGMYIRNTENPVHDSMDGNVNYHPFDGDAMLHAIRFVGGKASYRNKFVRTRSFEAEQKAGCALWAGLHEPVISGSQPGDVKSKLPGWGALKGALGLLDPKDTASTDVVVHAGRILPTWYLCGEAYAVNLDTLETEGVHKWSPKDGISAHCKVDENTGELLFFNYGKRGMHYGVVNCENELIHYVEIPLPRPRNSPHDMSFTTNFVILNDFPRNRFGVLPRYGSAEEIRWFECKHTYVLHWLNAYEEEENGETRVVLDGYFMREADLFTTMFNGAGSLDFHDFQPQLYRWYFNLSTGMTEEGCLDDRVLEFGMFNQKWAGKKYRYAYSVQPNHEEFLFTGIVKHDLDTGDSVTLEFGPGRFGSESPVAPKVGGVDEDDAYLVSFVTDLKQDRSECLIIDAKKVSEGPLCTILLPHRICSGTHAFWADTANSKIMQRPSNSPLLPVIPPALPEEADMKARL